MKRCHPSSIATHPLKRLVLSLLFALCASPFAAHAQIATATLSGTIVDPNGAVVPGANVTITEVATRVQRTVTTNDQGSFTIPLLKPSTYFLEVQHQGFLTAEVKDIVLNVGDQRALHISMKVGDVKETVNITGEAPLINESPAVGTVVDRKFVENIPLNGRSFQDLISMTPGVVTQNPNTSPGGVGAGGDFSVNGQRTEANYYTVDGVSANASAGSGRGPLNTQPAASGSVPAGTILGTSQSIVPVDALQEFKVLASSYTAEYGRAPGGQFSLVTRSGTNDFHGNVFDFIRNDRFDANDWFNNSLGRPISPLRQNLFGGSIGGPVFFPRFGEGGSSWYNGRNRTFFFFAYEALRLVQPQAAIIQFVPDTFMRQQAPAALQPILSGFPVQNGIDFGTAAAPSLAQFIASYSLPSRFDSTSVRIDHSFGPKLSLSFRASNSPSSRSTRALSVLNNFEANTQMYTLGAVSQFSNKSNNDFRIGYTRSRASIAGNVDSFGGAVPLDLGVALGAGSSTGSLAISIQFAGIGSSFLQATTANNRLRQWNLFDAYSFMAGNHQIKLGVDYRRLASPNTPASPTFQAVFQNSQQLLTNRPVVVGVARIVTASPIFDETAVFVQDEWRIRSRLNLSLGLRWEVNPAPHGANGNDAYTLLGNIKTPSSLVLAPRGTPLWKTTWNNFAPRLGFAWTARNHLGWETVLRGGGGVYFDTNNQQASSGFSGIGFSALAQYSGVSLPLTPAQVNLIPSTAPPYNSNIYYFPPDVKPPYAWEWNLAVQQAIARRQTITLSYVGSATKRMGGLQSLSIQTLNPNFTSSSRVIYFVSGLTSDYDALQAQFQRFVTHGIQALASYTWSHCIDFGSSYTSLSAALGIGETAFIRGNCDFDVRHNFQGGLSWDLPSLNGNKAVGAVVNHWAIDGRVIARTGFPIPLGGNQPIDPVTGSQYSTGLNLVGNQPIYLYGSQYPGGRIVNKAAFSQPAAGQLGNAPRNFVRGFGEWQINMAVRREFPIHERLRLQFRAEAFNLLNHPNFGRIDPTLSSSTFGRATNMLNQPLSTLSSLYQQGGPRSMQFALKILF